MLPEDRLAQITQRFEFLEAQLNAGAEPAKIAAISREYAELRPVVEQIARWRAARDGIDEAQAMLTDPEAIAAPVSRAAIARSRLTAPVMSLPPVMALM